MEAINFFINLLSGVGALHDQSKLHIQNIKDEWICRCRNYSLELGRNLKVAMSISNCLALGAKSKLNLES